jgi:outer membrane murein-binding lipoprotein Lpp
MTRDEFDSKERWRFVSTWIGLAITIVTLAGSMFVAWGRLTAEIGLTQGMVSELKADVKEITRAQAALPALDARIKAAETTAGAINQRLDRIENKLDRALESRGHREESR